MKYEQEKKQEAKPDETEVEALERSNKSELPTHMTNSVAWLGGNKFSYKKIRQK